MEDIGCSIDVLVIIPHPGGVVLECSDSPVRLAAVSITGAASFLTNSYASVLAVAKRTVFGIDLAEILYANVDGRLARATSGPGCRF